jgi:hypothetical protein
MKLDLFSLPIWIGNIDATNINIDVSNVKKLWLSKTPSTHHLSFKNKLESEQEKYVLETISKLISKDIKNEFKIWLLNIWVNDYKKDDYQEAHIHGGSDLSFIIYKKVNESHTVFYNPSNKLIHAFSMADLFRVTFSPQCRENQIIVFPSFLEHGVKKNSNNITISGNIKMERKNA